MIDTAPLVSVIIPVKNGDAWLEKTIPAILRQTLSAQMEIIAIDSGSTDKSLEILRKYPVRILSIAPSDFNHGATRNLGAEAAKGKYVVMTVQDAEPENEYWLQTLLDGFDEDNVAGVCGQQIVPHDNDKNPVDWFRPISPPGREKYLFANAEEYKKLTSAEKRNVCRWDNVNAAYRRDILTGLPFRKTSFAEDALWAQDALLAGYAIVYNMAARVKHYHFETPDYTFRRIFTVYYHVFKSFGVKPSYNGNELISMLKNGKLLWQEKELGWGAKWKWLLYNIRLRKAVRKATHTFNRALENGEKTLDEKQLQINAVVPQAIKPVKP
jgi:rhamnosyltransferase